jgi:hypothetical protein
MYQFALQHEVGIVLVAAILVLASGCAARLAVHPGAINAVDSAAYDALLIAEAAIDQAKAEYAAGDLAGNKKALDALIASYDVTRLSWLTYRGALTTNVPAQTYLDTVNKNLTDLANAIRNLKEAK